MASVSLRLPDDITQRLEHLASITGRSKTFYMLEAIREHLDDLEDLYLAEREFEAIRSGKSQTVPLEEVMKCYGMEGDPQPHRGQHGADLGCEDRQSP